MKWAGIVCILLGTSGMGIYVNSMMVMQLENLIQLRKGMICFMGEIRYGRTPLQEAMEAVGEHTSGMIRKFFHEVGKTIEQKDGKKMEQKWKETVIRCFSGGDLRKEDKKELIGFGRTLGYLDADMQLSAIELYIKKLEYAIEIEEREQAGKTKLCHVIGVMSGILISIVMI